MTDKKQFVVQTKAQESNLFHHLFLCHYKITHTTRAADWSNFIITASIIETILCPAPQKRQDNKTPVVVSLLAVFVAHSNPLVLVWDKLHRLLFPSRSRRFGSDSGSAPFRCSLCYKAPIKQILLILIRLQLYSLRSDRLLIWLVSGS